MALNAKRFFRLRKRGLIPYGENAEYETPRLEAIAKRMFEIEQEFKVLDAEIVELAGGIPMTNCEACGEEIEADEVQKCEICLTDGLCSVCIGGLDHTNPETGRLCGEEA